MKDFFFIFNSLALPEEIVLIYLTCSFASLVYISLKNKIQLSKFEDLKRLPAMQETQVRSLGWKVPLEKVMAIHSSILAWRIAWTEKAGGLQFVGSKKVRHDWVTNPVHRGTRDQIASICWIVEKAREFQKNIYFCFIDYAKAFDCMDHNKLENSSRGGYTRPPDLPPEKSVCRSRANS